MTEVSDDRFAALLGGGRGVRSRDGRAMLPSVPFGIWESLGNGYPAELRALLDQLAAEIAGGDSARAVRMLNAEGPARAQPDADGRPGWMRSARYPCAARVLRLVAAHACEPECAAARAWCEALCAELGLGALSISAQMALRGAVLDAGLELALGDLATGALDPGALAAKLPPGLWRAAALSALARHAAAHGARVCDHVLPGAEGRPRLGRARWRALLDRWDEGGRRRALADVVAGELARQQAFIPKRSPSAPGTGATKRASDPA